MPHLSIDFPSNLVKIYKISSKIDGILVSLPHAINEELNSIERLVMNHSCTLCKLITLLSYTPELRRFSCTNHIETQPK
jgi:hypothetical protein